MTPATMTPPQCPMPWNPREQPRPPTPDLRGEFLKALVMGSAALMLTSITASVTYFRTLSTQQEQLRNDVAIRNAQYMARFQAIEETLARAVKLLDNMENRLREVEQK